MTATLLAAGPSPAANPPTGLASAAPVGGDPRDFFNGCHTVTPPAPYTPAYGPWRAGRTLAETVAWLAYTLEGA